MMRKIRGILKGAFAIMLLAYLMGGYSVRAAEWEDTAKSQESAPVLAAGLTDGDVVVESGTCGENLTYSSTEEGKLIISGTGEMTSTPWHTGNYSSDFFLRLWWKRA